MIPMVKRIQPRHQLENRRIFLEERAKVFLQRQNLKTGRTGKKTTTTQNRKNHSKEGETTVTEEEDEEKHLNSTRNPLDDAELSVLISTITGDTDDHV